MCSIGGWPDDWARFQTSKYRDPAACRGLFHLFEPQSEAVPEVRLVLPAVNALKHCHLTINAPFTQAQCDMSTTEECFLNQNKMPSDTEGFVSGSSVNRGNHQTGGSTNCEPNPELWGDLTSAGKL